MTAHACDTPAGLRRLIVEGGLTEHGLQLLTEISPDAIRSFVSSDQSGTGLTTNSQPFSAEESMRLSILAAQLLDGMAIADDERLKGILESLTTEFRVTSQSIAQLAGLDVADVDEAQRDPQFLLVEKKYEIAVRAFYLLNAFSRARNR